MSSVDVSSFSGTVVNGTVELDRRVELPDQSKVHVTIVPIEDWRRGLTQAIAGLEELKKTHPIDSGGLHYTRDQLYERD